MKGILLFIRALVLFAAGVMLGILSTFGGVALGWDVLHAQNPEQAFWYGVPVCVVASGVMVSLFSWRLLSKPELQGLGLAFVTGFGMPVIWFCAKFFSDF
ncbi:MAG: hypothetical protein LBO00_04580 [Zoogloeaceae bacterium]|jgi:hypothetical protein|nr:hypothetical protein [Zoogloeaceae bacterium]